MAAGKDQIFSMDQPQTAHRIVSIPAPDFDFEDFPGYYEYDPLPPGHIRLVRCVRGQWHSPDPLNWNVRDLEIQIIQIAFHHAPPYDAISYTWGAATQEEEQWQRDQIFSMEPRIYPVRCDGKIIRVTRSLRDVLYMQRRYDFGDVQQMYTSMWGQQKEIWFYGVCINQDDAVERAMCVSMMSSIYARASIVLAWAGSEDHNTRPALEVTTKFRNFYALHREEINRGDYYHPDEEFMSLIGLEMPTEHEWCQWLTLFTRRWFSRAWIVQEAGLARKVVLMVGLMAFDLQDLILAYAAIHAMHLQYKALAAYNSRRHLYPEFSQLGREFSDLISGHWSMAGIVRIRNGAKVNRLEHFQFIMHRFFMMAHCSDPRDKVYASLGLAMEFNDSSNPSPAIDYTRR